MLREFSFFNEEEITFDDSGSVRELVEYAFEVYDYYEPLGMDVVTVFQPHHSGSSEGWITTDTSRSCAEEIENPRRLCFAYHMPGVFYFAEGGWGHHMPTLGNHPDIPDAVSLNIRFDDFKNTVVINGRYCFEDIIDTLKRTGYIDHDRDYLTVLAMGSGEAYNIPFSDPLMKVPLTDFVQRIESISRRIESRCGNAVYHEELILGGEPLRYVTFRDWLSM